MYDPFGKQGDGVEQAAEAMSDDELDGAIAALHVRERWLLIAGDIDSARQVAMDKSICLCVRANRSH
ncbi:hypothetical protein ABIC28_005168 [Rhodococcus sp. PvR044]|uniref:hypothetical protein n=1 Tax=Rhodococcus sp. PvR044 TaxID=3156402 RepID=UPI00339094CB